MSPAERVRAMRQAQGLTAICPEQVASLVALLFRKVPRV